MLSILFENLNSHLTSSFSEGWLSEHFLLLQEIEFDASGDLLKRILEVNYRDGIDGFNNVSIGSDGEFVGEFVDVINSRLTKRYSFTVSQDEISYKLLNPQDVNDKETEFAAATKKCTKSTPCGNTCIKKGLTCRKTPTSQQKEAIAQLTQQVQVVKRLKSGVADVPTSDLNLDPNRFQYKLIHSKSGTSGSLTGVKKFDPELAGIIQVWEDPKDGKTYVINGHNRANLAKDQGVDEVTVRYIKAQSAEEARATGALTNIAEGRGTPLDAAKFFRDTGISRQDLDAKGIPLKEKIATDGMALAGLNNGLFTRAITGDLAQDRAIAIGSMVKDHQQQSELVDLIDQHEKKNKKINNETIKELADMVANAPTNQNNDGGLFGLLGIDPGTRSLVVEKADIQADVKRRLVKEKKLFGIVGKSSAAQQLAKAGNTIDVDASKSVSDSADIALRVFDQEKNFTGVISKAVNDAALRIANGENPKKVKDEVYGNILKEIQTTYAGGKGQGSPGLAGGDAATGQKNLF